ncbi:MAG TPA: hypothetical protein VN328_07375 [Thermodesulfovibrionales bacterium]|nr:hypothetical protein [Thermodesulfovibrionales bacterium]
MNSLYDFLTHVKGVEYIISVLFIAGYILYAEVLKPKPFKTLVETGKEDMDFIRQTGYRNTMKTAGKIAAAPFIGLLYLVSLPFAFAFALLSTAAGGVLNLVGKEAAFGWRPMEAYFTGKKKKKDEKKTDEEK